MTAPRKLLTAWNLKARKELGQNFLNDPSFAQMLVAQSQLSKEDVVLEIGAGLGALTIPIAKIADKVYAIEKDIDLIALLKTELLVAGLSNVTILRKDILTVDLNELIADAGRKLVVMGNLPYNISSQVLVQLIKGRRGIRRAILMFQKELAERICAPSGIKAYGRLSVMLSYCAEIKSVSSVSAQLFFPRPKVDSRLLEIRFKQKPTYPAKSEALLFEVIKTAFGKRRKTLKNALIGNELQLDAYTAHFFLKQAGIDPVRRAETLSVDEFVCLSNCLFNRDKTTPHT
jgi:16S rRNA (adenine1518-N6/adenine1519-N6)-dimethyltransferase